MKKKQEQKRNIFKIYENDKGDDNIKKSLLIRNIFGNNAYYY